MDGHYHMGSQWVAWALLGRSSMPLAELCGSAVIVSLFSRATPSAVRAEINPLQDCTAKPHHYIFIKRI